MRAAIYARYSAGPNQTDVSIEGQEKTCRQYIARHGYTFAGLYADRHISGRTDKRPEFQRMIDDGSSGAFDVLVVYSLDRFSRDKYDSAIYKKVLRDHGVAVESASESIPGGPEGILFEGMLESMAEYYSAELSKKIRRGLDLKAEKAQSVGGPTPFGYVLKNGSYEKDEKAAPVVTEVFERYLAGASFTECGRWLSSLGFTTSRGKPFSSNTIRKMLTNKKYAGFYVYNGTEIEGGMPALVSEEVFYQVQKKMKKKKPRAPRGEYALTGKLIHGPCGSFMTGTSGTGKSGKVHYYYKCPEKDIRPVPRDMLEHAVAEHVRGALSEPQALDSLVDKLFTYQQEELRSDAQISALEANVKDLDRKIEHAVDALIEHGPDADVHARLESLRTDRAIMAADLEKLTAGPALSRDVIREGLQLALLHDSVTDAQVIKIFVHRVVLWDDRLLLEFNFQGAEGLEKSELLQFDLTDECSTIEGITRTLTVYHGRVLMLCSLQ